jgi:hypothetical protein
MSSPASGKTMPYPTASVNLYLAVESDALSSILSIHKWSSRDEARSELETDLNLIFSNSQVFINITLRLEETALRSPSSQTNSRTLDILSDPASKITAVNDIRKDAILNATEPADVIGLLNLTSSDPNRKL